MVFAPQIGLRENGLTFQDHVKDPGVTNRPASLPGWRFW